MRLRRDSQGNYRYEYIADEDNVKKLQDEIDALENSLYNFDKERFISLQNEIVGYVQDRENAIKEIQMDASLTEEERQARIAEINRLYNTLIQDVTDQTVTAQTNLYQSGADELNKIWEKEGKDFSEWQKKENPFNTFFTSPENYIPPKNGESLPHIIERTKNFLETKIEPEYKKYRRIMIVAHGALNAALMCNIEHRTLKNFWGEGLQQNLEETIFTFDGSIWKKISTK